MYSVLCKMEWNTSHFIKGWHSGQESSDDLKFLHDLYNCLNDLQKFFSFLLLSGANILLIFGENMLKYAVLTKNGRKIISDFVEIDYYPRHQIICNDNQRPEVLLA